MLAETSTGLRSNSRSGLLAAGLVLAGLSASGVMRESTPPPVSTVLPVPDFGNGLGLTLFSNSGPRVALLEAVADGSLTTIRPQHVQVHGGPKALSGDIGAICTRLRGLLPGVNICVGVQWDGWIENFARARNDAERQAVVRVYVDCARAAWLAGCWAVIWNSEGKAHANPAAARSLERAIVAQVRAACPGMLQALTTFDHPCYWDEVSGDRPLNAPGAPGFPWSAWLGDELIDGDGSAVDFWMPQTYASPGTGAMASKGALMRRLSTHNLSTEKAKSLGWIRRGAREVAYFQGHHVPAIQSVFHGAYLGLVFFWAAPKKTATVDGRLDADGFAACRTLAELAREDFSLSGLDPKLVIAWCQGMMKAAGILDVPDGDGVVGPKFRAAAQRAGWSGDVPDAALVSILKARSWGAAV